MAYVIATLVPLLVLALVIRIGRLRGRALWLPVIGLGWGIASTFIALEVNNRWFAAFGLASVITLGGPIAEEIIKAGVLPALTASRLSTWFVDGAVAGFAAATGFAIRENWLYLDRGANEGLSLALARVTSTNLMHAGCTALVGATLAGARTLGWGKRLIAVPAALVVSMSLHSVFNRNTLNSTSATLVTLIGIAVFAGAAGLVALGGPVSLRWARTSMQAQGLSAGEQSVLGRRGDVDNLLDEIEQRFGGVIAEQAERFIALQRRIGIASHSLQGSSDDTARAEFDSLQADANQLRREIGVFPMTWIRSHLPTESGPMGLWAGAAVSAAPAVVDSGDAGRPPGGLWATFDEQPKS
ncbi:unannotated protein [freshwater metagenome]|uniref:Unannotated protein n=1 Tax=freshwater metagenome TaxID=449393 RepID=A0A6J7F6P3_9ZZZZ